MKSEVSQSLSDAFTRLGHNFRRTSPDRSPIVNWARRHIILPESYAIPGHFNVDLSPWMRAIFEALQDESIRTVTVSKAIQSGGTLIADVWVPWLIVNQPGPISWTMHTDDMVSIHAKTRLNPIMERCAPVAALLPRAGPMRTTTEIYFGGFFMILNSANLSDQQSNSIRYKINDEIWHPRWQSVYKDALGRVTKFEEMGTSKVLNISQGGWENDVSDVAYRVGHQAEWSATCPQCKKLHPLSFRQFCEDEKTRAGVIWAKEARRDDRTFDVGLAGSTARFRCPHCQHESADTDEVREAWKTTGEYVSMNPDAPAQTRSFHFEAIVSRSMKLLAEEFCNAENEFIKTGSDSARRTFRQKREAKAWIEERQTIILPSSTSDYTLEEYWEGQSIPDEVHRFMVIDRQQTHWWIEVGAWTATPEYWQLYFGRVETLDQVRMVQARYKVPDRCTVQDRRYQQAMVDADCLRFGWIGMEGVRRKTWSLRNEASGFIENYPHSDPMFASIAGASVPYYQFSSNHCKDIVANSISGKGFVWKLPKNVNPVYPEHLKAEEKKEIRGGVWEWIEIKQNFNHGFDTSSMMVCIAIIAGLVRFTLEKPE